MDPNELLDLVRRAISRVHDNTERTIALGKRLEKGETVSEIELAEIGMVSGRAMADLVHGFEQLDRHLSQGKALPDAWGLSLHPSLKLSKEGTAKLEESKKLLPEDEMNAKVAANIEALKERYKT